MISRDAALTEFMLNQAALIGVVAFCEAATKEMERQAQAKSDAASEDLMRRRKAVLLQHKES